MIEIPDGMTDEEFHEFYHSKTDEERIQIVRQLALLARENGLLTDEEFAEREEKTDRHAQLIEAKKEAELLLARIERAKQIVADRINARFADMTETASPTFFDDLKSKKSH